MANYIRFQRGSLEAYNNLKNLNKLNEYTLYFIYDNNDSSIGSLYMGSHLISGGDATVLASALKDLTDVIINESGENYFLVQNKEGKWASTSLNQVSALIESKLSKPDLSIYATKTELKELEEAIGDTLDTALENINNILATKVDKVIYEVPVLDKDGNPTYDENGQEIFKEVEGTLVTPEDREKLNALVLDEDGSGVEISGTVNAENVEGLGTWITTYGNTHIKNLTENNLSQELLSKINFITEVNNEYFTAVNGKLDFTETVVNNLTAVKGEMNFINSVDTDVFDVDNAGKLTLTAVSSSALVPVLGNLNLLPHSADNFTLVDEINNIYDILSWSEIENSI